MAGAKKGRTHLCDMMELALRNLEQWTVGPIYSFPGILVDVVDFPDIRSGRARALLFKIMCRIQVRAWRSRYVDVLVNKLTRRTSKYCVDAATLICSSCFVFDGITLRPIVLPLKSFGGMKSCGHTLMLLWYSRLFGQLLPQPSGVALTACGSLVEF